MVFSHPLSPEAGIQVPAGTVCPGEPPQKAALREAEEETGLRGLRVVRYLGERHHPVPELDEVHRRHFYHLACEETPSERWRRYEMDPHTGEAPPLFELFWVPLPHGVPPLAPGHDALLPELLATLAGSQDLRQGMFGNPSGA